jgi:hypothetical protein
MKKFFMASVLTGALMLTLTGCAQSSQPTTQPETNLPATETTMPETTVPSTQTTLPSTETTLPSTKTTIPSTETTSPSGETTLPPIETTVPPETSVPPAETATTGYVYQNTQYGFELTFPESWGQVTADELPGDEISISSTKSLDRNFVILMVSPDQKDTITDTEGTKTIYLGENDTLAFYARLQSCLGGPTCDAATDATILSEAESIAKTFTNL